jgi:tRNA(fMet)-specific endonuclease VapC
VSRHRVAGRSAIVLSEPMRPIPDPTVMGRIAMAGDTIATASPVWHEIELGRLRIPAGERPRAIESIIDAFARVPAIA